MKLFVEVRRDSSSKSRNPASEAPTEFVQSTQSTGLIPSIFRGVTGAHHFSPAGTHSVTFSKIATALTTNAESAEHMGLFKALRTAYSINKARGYHAAVMVALG